MADNKATQDKSNNEKIAWENCCAQHVVQSMFDHVSKQDFETLANRSDQDEIIKFSYSLLESELIFGSPDDEVLESVERKISQSAQKAGIHKRG